ncbi:MAG: NYN domain-containing protein [Acidimicrobiia bacterium]|nr:NYN domain-containing protein [Acidimicrobiia bacterium]
MTVSTEGAETTRGQTIVYVDGFNLYYGAVKNTRYKWLDLEAMCRSLLRGDQIVKIRYFTARVNDRADDPQLASRQDTYLRALTTLPLVEIHYGHFQTRAVRLPRVNRQRGQSRTIKVLKTEEKGSDVNLATHLLLDAFKGRCDTAAVVSNVQIWPKPSRSPNRNWVSRWVSSTRTRARVGHTSFSDLTACSTSRFPVRCWRRPSCRPSFMIPRGRSASLTAGKTSKARRSGPSPSHRSDWGDIPTYYASRVTTQRETIENSDLGLDAAGVLWGLAAFEVGIGGVRIRA